MKMQIVCEISISSEAELQTALEYLETNYDTRIGYLNSTDQTITFGLNSDTVALTVAAIQALRTEFGETFSWSQASKISDTN